MNSPIIWIFIPIITSLIFYLRREMRLFYYWLPIFLCSILIIFALIIPIDQQINIGKLSFELKSSLNILGRVFILSNDDRSLITLFYVLGLVWFVGSDVIQAEKKLIPLGMTIVSLFVAAFAVQPFLYAAIIIELAVLISMPMIVSKKTDIGSGILRYFILN